MKIDNVVGIASSNEIRENLANNGGELESVAGESGGYMDAVVVRMASKNE